MPCFRKPELTRLTCIWQKCLKACRSDLKTGAAMQTHLKHSGCWIRPLHLHPSCFWGFSGKAGAPPHTLWTVRTGKIYCVLDFRTRYWKSNMQDQSGSFCMKYVRALQRASLRASSNRFPTVFFLNCLCSRICVEETKPERDVWKVKYICCIFDKMKYISCT